MIIYDYNLHSFFLKLMIIICMVPFKCLKWYKNGIKMSLMVTEL